ncbi:DUF6344 domain-containing protein [Streptomyces cavernicola]|uniref:DUF6344 domain-containing protein n=1 Tax=Streptomyces cavernicola TaxID=3043613 RepID=A0ABT6S3W6_9ACTN|nr:DUF6344 domain-containing protein [Streptomyces sp. B-S-A6]MDI3402781.1 DUF6344 domain-containing protein [Streptomyces sp. B-S-A6]
MAPNNVTRIWSVVVAALLAFFASLGLITTATAAPAAPQQDSSGSSSAEPAAKAPYVAPAPKAKPYELNRPPTMKQRIRAEAHGSSPSTRGLTLATPLSDVNQVDAATEADVVNRERVQPADSEELAL